MLFLKNWVDTSTQGSRLFIKAKIKNWKSKLFSIEGDIETYALPTNAEGAWTFTDDQLIKYIKTNEQVYFTIAITNVPLENNYYARRINNNIVAITFFEMKDILNEKNIPLENLILRCIYAYSLVYLRFNNQIPSMQDEITRKYTHDEVKGCLFDMTGYKKEVVYSCNKPILCDACTENSKYQKVSVETINIVKNEIKKIKKELFYDLKDNFQKHPIRAFIIIAVTSSLISQVVTFILKSVIKYIT